MSKLTNIVVAILIFLSFLFLYYSETLALHNPSIQENCRLVETIPSPLVTVADQPGSKLDIKTDVTYKFHVNENATYKAYFRKADFWTAGLGEFARDNLKPDASGFISVTIKPDRAGTTFEAGNKIIEIERKGAPGNYCTITYTIHPKPSVTQTLTTCKDIKGVINPNATTPIEYAGIINPAGKYQISLQSSAVSKKAPFNTDSSGNFSINLGQLNPDTYAVKLQKEVQRYDPTTDTVNPWFEDTNCVIQNLTVTSTQANPKPDTTLKSVGSGTAQVPGSTAATSSGPKAPPVPATGQPCYSDKDKKNPIDGTISTAIGCIRTDPVGLVQDFFKLAVGIGGGIALLLMIAGAFQMISSAGNPESIKEGKERFTSAIIGLLFVIFSVLLLRIIGVDILGFGDFLGVVTK